MKPQKLCATKVVKVELQTLRIHPHAQRLIVPSKLVKLRKEMDLDAIGVLHAVEYEINGETAIWIIDGQHRWRVLMEMGLGEWLVEVQINVDVKDDARASALFIELNNRTGVHPFDKFKNARQAGEESAIGITKIASEHNLTVDRSSRDGLLCCVTVLDTVFNLDRGQTLTATLGTAVAAWGHTAPAVEGKLIEGLSLVYKQFNGTIDRPALVKKLAKYPGGPSGLLGDARGLRQFRHASIARCVAEQIIETYNAGRRVGRLDPV